MKGVLNALICFTYPGLTDHPKIVTNISNVLKNLALLIKNSLVYRPTLQEEV